MAPDRDAGLQQDLMAVVSAAEPVAAEDDLPFSCELLQADNSKRQPHIKKSPAFIFIYINKSSVQFTNRKYAMQQYPGIG